MSQCSVSLFIFLGLITSSSAAYLASWLFCGQLVWKTLLRSDVSFCGAFLVIVRRRFPCINLLAWLSTSFASCPFGRWIWRLALIWKFCGLSWFLNFSIWISKSSLWQIRSLPLLYRNLSSRCEPRCLLNSRLGELSLIKLHPCGLCTQNWTVWTSLCQNSLCTRLLRRCELTS